MKIFLFLCATAAAVLSLGTCSLAKGAPHEIEGLIWLLISAVSFVGAGIIEALRTPQESEEQAALKRGELLVCPLCKGYVSKGATKCRHCATVFGAPAQK